MAVVAGEHSVVQRLRVVGICTAVDQQSAGQLVADRMPGLASRPRLALAEAQRQHGERVGRPSQR